MIEVSFSGYLMHVTIWTDFSLSLHPPCRTPLHYAAANGRYQCTVTLVSAGAEVNEPDQTGCTPLHYSAASQAFSRLGKLVSLVLCSFWNTRGNRSHQILFKSVVPDHWLTSKTVKLAGGLWHSQTVGEQKKNFVTHTYSVQAVYCFFLCKYTEYFGSQSNYIHFWTTTSFLR